MPRICSHCYSIDMQVVAITNPTSSPNLQRCIRKHGEVPLRSLTMPIVPSALTRHVRLVKLSRRPASGDTAIFHPLRHFLSCKEFCAPNFTLSLPNYLYLSLIIANYTSATALSYLCNAIRENIRTLPQPLYKGGSSYYQLSRALMGSRTLQTK